MIVNTLKLLTEKPDKTSLKNDIFNGSFNPSTHRTVNRLRTTDFHCVHCTHRSDFLMRTERKIVRTYAVRIVIYFAGLNLCGSLGWVLVLLHRLKLPSYFILLTVPMRYVCYGSNCLMFWC